jgi:hypothetical protein
MLTRQGAAVVLGVGDALIFLCMVQNPFWLSRIVSLTRITTDGPGLQSPSHIYTRVRCLSL